MRKRTSSQGLLLMAAAAAAAGLAAYFRRPVKPPLRAGTWHPVEGQRSGRK